MKIMTSYSLILSNTVFHVTNGVSSCIDQPIQGNDSVCVSSEDCFATEDLTTLFTTRAPGSWYRNVKTILSRCFKRVFPRMTD